MAWDLLLTSDIGLLSLATIAFVIVMAIYIARYALQHAEAESKAKTLGEGQRGAAAH